VHELVKDQSSRPSRPEIHNVLRRWRSLAGVYEPERLLVGETWVMDIDELASFYGRNDELQLAFNFLFMFAGLDATALGDVVERTDAALPSGFAGTQSLFDEVGKISSRAATRQCRARPESGRGGGEAPPASRST
jgi:hypothetical protein